MKKIIALMLVLIIAVIGFAACKDETEDTVSPTIGDYSHLLSNKENPVATINIIIKITIMEILKVIFFFMQSLSTHLFI